VTPYAFEKRVRRLLLLIPAARAAGDAGLPISRALALTGARSIEELQADVLAVDDVAVGTDADADHLLMEIEGGRVRVDVDMGFGRPPPLSLREGAALLAALRPFARTGGKTVERALRKIERAVPDHLRREVTALARATDLALGPPGEWAAPLQGAIDHRVEVEIEYRAESDGSHARKRLEPRALFPRGGEWYLIAWNLEKAAEHLYRLDRVTGVVVGTRHFAEHRGPGLERLARRRLYFASGAERRVVLRFSPAAAPAARERWGAAATPQPDGSLLVTLETTPNDHLHGMVLGWGGAAQIVSPPDVREALRRRVEALRARYG
jgi:predicted DNA-binding transcriptional regulator YafY